MVGALALLWVLAASHCFLETIPALDFLRCSAESPTSSDPDHGCDDSCCTVESASFPAQRHQDALPICIVAIVPSDVVAVAAGSLPPEGSLGILTAAPPELTKTWQFLSRAALPPRAPSLAG